MSLNPDHPEDALMLREIGVCLGVEDNLQDMEMNGLQGSGELLWRLNSTLGEPTGCDWHVNMQVKGFKIRNYQRTRRLRPLPGGVT